MKKVILLLVLFGVHIFASINLQTASKEELMSIKGIGDKKAEQILEYRKSNTINSVEDLKNIKGFGDSIISNIKNDIRVKKDTKSKENSKEKSDNSDKKANSTSSTKTEKLSNKKEN